ncbi:MAG TPA: SLBB domain-containing protein [Verrucomicrobiae bacterium]|jgi:polysaccharide export outer membrane protein|nr:SLBB domain-containing protein [Verrucomicrobiae bacterium]
MKNLGILCGLAAAMALMAGCASTGSGPGKFPELAAPSAVIITNQLDASLLQPPTAAFVLGPGDQLDLEMTGNAASRATVTVGLDGKIYYSLLPGIDVMGLTVDQARARVEAELSKYVIQSKISMSLRLVGSEYVWLVGRMSRPGIYPMPGPMTLLEALTMAGGTASALSAVNTVNLADLRHSFVMRQGRVLPVNFVSLLQEGDMSQNIYLQPNDFVFIPSSLSQEVYVLGSVVTPRTVPFSDPMTLISAIAGANGPADNAYLGHVAIVRGSLSQPQLIEVDYNAVLRGKAPNVLLEPGDIVYVPLSPYRYITDYANLIVNTFVRTWAANMGTRAVEGTTTVGVAVPVGPTGH